MVSENASVPAPVIGPPVTASIDGTVAATLVTVPPEPPPDPPFAFALQLTLAVELKFAVTELVVAGFRLVIVTSV